MLGIIGVLLGALMSKQMRVFFQLVNDRKELKILQHDEGVELVQQT